MNPVEHDPSLLAAYALGGLEPAEQNAVQAHVAGCPECQLEVREVTNLRLALDEVPPEAFMDGPPAEGDLLLQKTLRRARAEAPPVRRRGWAPATITVAAAIAIAVALGGGVLLGRETAPVAGGPTTPAPDNAVVGRATDPGTGATMAVSVVPKAGWVTVHADVSGIKAGLKCELRVVPNTGESILAGSWLVAAKGEAEGTPLDGSALIDPKEVKAVEVVTADGKTMVSVPV